MSSILRTGRGVRPISNGQPLALLAAGGKGRRVQWVEKFGSTLALRFGTLAGLTNDLTRARVRDPNCVDRTVYVPLDKVAGGFVITR